MGGQQKTESAMKETKAITKPPPEFSVACKNVTYFVVVKMAILVTKVISLFFSVNYIMYFLQ